MKSESLVIVNHDVTVNDLSNFAHTAHHARRVVTAGNFVGTRKKVGLCSLLSLTRYLESSYTKLVRFRSLSLLER